MLSSSARFRANREKFEVNIAIHDPASFAATLLKEALARRGIRILGKVVRADAVARVNKPFDESKLTEIASVESQPLSEMLKVVNKESQNLHTELLLRQLGASGGQHELDEYGRPKTTIARGNEVRRQFLQKAGVDVAPLSLRDGSGLARQDLVTPRATVRLLEFMLTHLAHQRLPRIAWNCRNRPHAGTPNARHRSGRKLQRQNRHAQLRQRAVGLRDNQTRSDRSHQFDGE